MAGKQAQSAMEYLITYGWAILVVGIAVSALYFLGVFSSTPSNLAKPGQCAVQRPNGPGTSELLALGGICNGELPQSVAEDFNAVQPAFVWGQNATYAIGQTVTMWIYPTQSSASGTFFSVGQEVVGACQDIFSVGINSGGTISDGFGCNSNTASGVSLKYNQWNFIGVEAIGADNAIVYVDGSSVPIRCSPGACVEGRAPTEWGYRQVCIGCGISELSGPPAGGGFYGMISNVQLYSTVLSSSTLNAMYLEGIGGVPIDLQSLTGWWPLNGDSNDYSGNGGDLQPYNTTYTDLWMNNYTAP